MLREYKAFDKNEVIPSCYHCGVRKLNLSFCEIWGIKICTGCLETHHLPHHPSCSKDAHKTLEGRGPARTSFALNLTHYTGRTLSITCTRGMGLRLDDHWAGTYLIYSAGMVLVLEDRENINRAIIQGLKSISEES